MSPTHYVEGPFKKRWRDHRVTVEYHYEEDRSVLWSSDHPRPKNVRHYVVRVFAHLDGASGISLSYGNWANLRAKGGIEVLRSCADDLMQEALDDLSYLLKRSGHRCKRPECFIKTLMES